MRPGPAACRFPVQKSIDVSKDTLESALDKGGASPTEEGPTPVVPSVKKWHPAERGGSLFQIRQDMLEGAIRKQVSRYQETGDPIGESDAVALVRRIKNLYLSDTFDGHAAYLNFLAGQCLTLKEGSAMPDEYITASAQIEMPPIVSFNLAIPAGLDRAFGSESFDWLCSRCESVARGLGQQRSPSVSFTDHFGFVLDPVHHVRGESQLEFEEVPVVLAPNEATIAEYIRRAVPSADRSADYWDALVKAGETLNWSRQPLGDALIAWMLCARDRKTIRPDGRKADGKSKNALRGLAFDISIDALNRCGIPPTRNRDRRWLRRAHGWQGEIDPDYNPPAGRAIVTKVFDMTRT